MKARAVGLPAEDYTTDHIRDPAHLYSGCHYADDLPAELIGRLYEQEGEEANADFPPAADPLSNRDIGFLPGDIASKIKMFMQPFHDNLGVIRSQFSKRSEMFQRLQTMQNEGKLAIEPQAYIRGRSLVKMLMIVEKAQNLAPHEVTTIITRAGEGTKIVFTGDIHQIDHPYLGSRSNGLSTLIDRMQGQRLYAHIDLRKGEGSELAELASNIL